MAEFVLKYADPRGSVHQRANQRRIANQHRAAAIPPVNIGSGARILIRQQIVAIRHDRVAMFKFKMPAGAAMAQEVKE